MALYKSILAYDGTDFHGFQRQAAGTRTVQAVVEEGLREIGWSESTIHAAGRTDTGVHAVGQVISFDLAWKHSTGTLVRAMNAAMPMDVAVQKIEIAPEGFHARYSASYRMYVYRIYLGAERDPFRDRYALRIAGAPDQDRLREAAKLFVGSKDFGAFGRSPDPEGSTVREIYKSRWRQETGEVLFKITANAFLYRMVRKIVWACLAVASNSATIPDLEYLLNHPEERWEGGLAPAKGLTLREVGYKPI